MRVVAANGETLIWCRECSGYSRYRMGHKLIIRCTPESENSKEHGRMKRRMEVLEEGRVPARRESSWKLNGKRSQSQGKNKEEKEMFKMVS